MIPQFPAPGSLLLMALHLFHKYCSCGSPAFALCDWKNLTHRSGTCDEPVCARHVKEVLPGKFLCLRHQLLYDGWMARRQFSEQQQKSFFSEAA